MPIPDNPFQPPISTSPPVLQTAATNADDRQTISSGINDVSGGLMPSRSMLISSQKIRCLVTSPEPRPRGFSLTSCVLIVHLFGPISCDYTISLLILYLSPQLNLSPYSSSTCSSIHDKMTDLRASNLPSTISSYTTGATAQTGGFVQADNSSALPSNSVFESGGGLASSPNVPKPGTSINPQTGKPHTAGLTRAQLEAQKAGEAAFQGGQNFADPGLVSSATTSKPGPVVNVAHEPAPDVDPTDATQAGALSTKELEAFKNKGADLLDPAPQTEQVRRGSISNVAKESKMRRPSDVSGREQAARQLAGLVPDTETASAGSSTPGQELPGGWGAIKPTPLPGSGPHAPTSLYEDVTEGLGKMGQAAFSVIPSPIKDAFHGPGSPKGRRSSATGLIDHAKAQASKVAEGLQETIQNTQRRASANFGPDGTIRKQVMHFVDEAFQSTKEASSAEYGFIHSGPHGRVAAVPRVSHPTEELAGAQPGEHSDGVGALPGTVNETGVAILPDERNRTHFSLPSHELIGALNREHSSGRLVT
ncbi:hypothetical protein I307_05737 [Cryptococcus deuterogattii 99/473]|nr:hypothetical protein I307_05737 [Cryptococcus deuterogattii 99/473]